MATTTEIKEHKMTVIVGGVNEFYTDLTNFKKSNTIHEKYISSQLAQMPNPKYLKGVTSASQPEFIMSVMISAVIFFEPKEGHVTVDKIS